MTDLPANFRLALQQRVLPDYRVPFCEALAKACPGGLSVFAGLATKGENISIATQILESEESNHLHTWDANKERTKILWARARNVHFLNPQSPIFLCWQQGVLDWLEAWQPEALIVEANPRYLSTRLAVNWMHARGRSVLGWGLGVSAQGGFFGLLRRWERLPFLRSLDGWIAYSRRGAEQYRALGLRPERIFTACNAVTSRPVSPPPERLDDDRKRLVLLFVGRLQERKRIDNLLYACASLPTTMQPRLVVVGEGPAREGWQALAQRIYPLAEFPGARRGPELAPYFAAADLFVLPGTGGLAVQQAMASGLPVVVAQGDGTQEDLVRPGCGWQVRSDDLGDLAQTLQTALSDRARLRSMGNEAYRIVRDEVNLERMVEEFLKAVLKTVGDKGSNG